MLFAIFLVSANIGVLSNLPEPYVSRTKLQYSTESECRRQADDFNSSLDITLEHFECRKVGDD